MREALLRGRRALCGAARGGGLYRANADASDSSIFQPRVAESYFEYDGWMYLVSEDHGWRFSGFADGTGEEELLRTDVSIAAFTLTKIN
jgi:hypothetical protein